jgi:hypothetical protein
MSYILKWHVAKRGGTDMKAGVKVTYFNKYLNVSIQHIWKHVTQFREDKKTLVLRLLAPMVLQEGENNHQFVPR